jgi:hypothetical protein
MLLMKGRIHGTVLDYGCGKGDDVEWLTQLQFYVRGYDPIHQPNGTPLIDRYDTVLCTYVLNVLEPNHWDDILSKLWLVTKKGGTAYIAVRRDAMPEWQYKVELDLPIVGEERGRFIIYAQERT